MKLLFFIYSKEMECPTLTETLLYSDVFTQNTPHKFHHYSERPIERSGNTLLQEN